MLRTRIQEIPKKLATRVISAYPTILKFPKTLEEIDLGPVINIPIPIWEPNLKAEYTDVDYKPWLVIEKFRRIEQEILHDPKPKSDIRKLKDVTVKENELIDYWEFSQLKRPSVFWNRKKDGRYIEPEQIWYTKNNEKRIIPAHEILDDNYGKNKERNDTIENIRNRFLRGYKTGRGNYENLGTYFYKSHYHKELFLEIIQALGLVKKDLTEPKKSTVEIKAIESGFNPHVFTSREMAVSSNLYQEDEL